MTVHFVIRLALLAWAWCGLAGGVMTRLSTNDLSLTSSTLAWVTAGDKLPAHAVAFNPDESGAGSSGVYWCRGSHRGTYLPGVATPGGPCRVPFLRKVHNLDRFDILVSVNGSARLHFSSWDKFTAKPYYAVLTPDRMLVVARDDSGLGGPLMPGSLGLRTMDRHALVMDGEATRTMGKASVLVEEEPESYSLHKVILNAARQEMDNSTITLTIFNLTNPLDHDDTVNQLVTYTATEMQYWGRFKGTVAARGLDVTTPRHAPVAMPRVPRNLLWGVENSHSYVGTANLTHELQAGVGVEVQLVGVMRNYEAPYSAILTAHYHDGSTQVRPIVSFHTHKALVSVTAKYIRYFSLADGADLPIEPTADSLFQLTTTTTTTTTTSTTTTTTTTTTTEPPTTTSTEPPTEIATEAMVEVSWHPESDSHSKDSEAEQYRVGKDESEVVGEARGEPSQAVVARPDDCIISALASLFTTLVLRYYSSF